jgi:hypothetical protein
VAAWAITQARAFSPIERLSTNDAFMATPGQEEAMQGVCREVLPQFGSFHCQRLRAERTTLGSHGGWRELGRPLRNGQASDQGSVNPLCQEKTTKVMRRRPSLEWICVRSLAGFLQSEKEMSWVRASGCAPKPCEQGGEGAVHE